MYGSRNIVIYFRAAQASHEESTENGGRAHGIFPESNHTDASIYFIPACFDYLLEFRIYESDLKVKC
jgi:hypothetical protein